jgi:hypothetical protein
MAAIALPPERRDVEDGALLAVSRAVVRGGPLDEVLDAVVEEAAAVVGAHSASILLARADGALRLAAGAGKSERYRVLLTHPPRRDPAHMGPSCLALERGEPLRVRDTETDPRYAPWRDVARQEGYRSMVAFPLRADGERLGALNVYRAAAGEWAPADLRLLTVLAHHAAAAIGAARLIERQQHQLAALSTLVDALRTQSHEHANRLHVLQGLLALGEEEHARAFLAELTDSECSPYASVTRRVGHPTVAGLLVAEMGAARQREIDMRLTGRSRLERLTPRLGDAEVVTVLGNLLRNAVEAVAPLPRGRRRIAVELTDRADRGRATVLSVRDWGDGLAGGDAARLFRRGYSTKGGGHHGVGLALVASVAEAAGGSVAAEPRRPGACFRVTIPN